MPTIESTRHPLIQSTHALSQKKARDNNGLILVETKHPIEEALKAGLVPVHYFELPDTPKTMRPVWPDDASIYHVNEAIMKKLSTTDSIPTCIAVFQKPITTSSTWFSRPTSPSPFYVIADRMQDPGNLGTLIRTACAFSCNGILLTQQSVDPYSPKVIRSSVGLVFHIPILSLNQSLEESFTIPEISHYQWLFTTGHDVWHSHTTQHYRSIHYQQPSILVLGNEGQGIGESQTLPPHAQAIRIPTNPNVESLNVSMSAAIILAEAYYQKSHK